MTERKKFCEPFKVTSLALMKDSLPTSILVHNLKKKKQKRKGEEGNFHVRVTVLGKDWHVSFQPQVRDGE